MPHGRASTPVHSFKPVRTKIVALGMPESIPFLEMVYFAACAWSAELGRTPELWTNSVP
jgi:hypothetical protein